MIILWFVFIHFSRSHGYDYLVVCYPPFILLLQLWFFLWFVFMQLSHSHNHDYFVVWYHVIISSSMLFCCLFSCSYYKFLHLPVWNLQQAGIQSPESLGIKGVQLRGLIKPPDVTALSYWSVYGALHLPPFCRETPVSRTLILTNR